MSIYDFTIGGQVISKPPGKGYKKRNNAGVEPPQPKWAEENEPSVDKNRY